MFELYLFSNFFKACAAVIANILTDLINAADGDPVRQVKDMTGGGVEYAFEAIGLKQTAEQAFYMLAKGGTATVIGPVPNNPRSAGGPP